MGTKLVGLEEALTEELFRPFAFGSHEIGCCKFRQNCWVICLERRVEAIEVSASVGCLVFVLGGYDALIIGAPWEFDGF